MRIRLKSALILALFLAAAMPAGQQAPLPTLVHVTTVVAKPAAVAEFEDYVKKINAAAAKIGLSQRVSAYQVVSGTSSFTYLFAVRLAKWADLDALPSPPEIVLKAHGETEGGKILRGGRATLESAQTEVHRYLPDLSTNFKMLDPIPTYANMIRTEIRPDMVNGYTEYLSKLKAAQEQSSNHPTALRLASVSGPANLFITTQYHNRFADRDSWPAPGDLLRKSAGDAEWRRLTEISSRAIARRETWVIRHRPDLSRGGARATSN